ncbi:MAG: hypothetical protein KDB80_07665 [Planctomycetes bacterium]|nr:hypothetical protein [Planctomycetota bacterium]
MTTRVTPTADAPDLVVANLPASKSHAQRALLLAGLLPGERCLFDLGSNDDTDVCRASVQALGARISTDAEDCVVIGVDHDRADAAPVEVWSGESGTTARMVAAATAVLGRWIRIDGAPGLRRRPMHALTDVLRRAGVRVEGDALPLVIDARDARWPDVVTVDGRTTTQVASGLMLGIGVRHARGLLPSPRALRVEHPNAVNYLRLTAHVAGQFGIPIVCESDGDSIVFRFESIDNRLVNWTAARDASAAAFPIALAAMLGCGCELPDAGDDPHPDWRIGFDVKRIVERPTAEVVCDQIRRRPDTFPALVALAATQPGTTRFVGAPALRTKESDRITAMREGLDALGVACEELDDGLVVHGPLPAGDTPIRVPTPADHRIVMAFALLGAVRPGGVELDESRAVAKSWPGFWNWFARYANVRAV